MTEAHDVLRYVPLVYMVSPSTGKRVCVALHNGLSAADAHDLAARSMENEFTDTALDVLHELRLVKLIEHAIDWRFMTDQERLEFCTNVPNVYEEPAEDLVSAEG
ncbi:hypothetical protein FS819_028775 (plasmid) [Allorhizobium sp. Av2]|nr:hypothetical protein [Allorhizobium sp. Av2]